MALYAIYNGAMPTTAAMSSMTTGTVIKTLLQIKLGTGIKGKVVEWGISFDGSAAATPGKVELVETGTVFGTVTAAVAADIHKFGDPNDIDPTTSLFSVGTSATGAACTAEGSITASRLFDYQLLPPTAPYVKQFPLGREPVINVGTALRIRVTFGAAINAVCYVVVEL
jgi:hypothetical protein